MDITSLSSRLRKGRREALVIGRQGYGRVVDPTFPGEVRVTGEQNLATQMGWCPMQNVWKASWTGDMDYERHKGNRVSDYDRKHLKRLGIVHRSGQCCVPYSRYMELEGFGTAPSLTTLRFLSQQEERSQWI